MSALELVARPAALTRCPRLPQLPVDLQQKVKSCLNSHQKEQQQRKPDFKVIRVLISTFPPTAMVYAVDKAGEGENTAAAGG